MNAFLFELFGGLDALPGAAELDQDALARDAGVLVELDPLVYVAEPMVDNFWKVFYLGWLIGLWLGPAWFLGRAFSSGPDHAWLRYALPLAVFWICYPVSQMSSLSGPRPAAAVAAPR